MVAPPDKVKIFRLKPEDALPALDFLFRERNIWDNLDDGFRVPLGIYELFCRVGIGEVRVYACVKGNVFIGGGMGEVLPDGYFCGHFLFRSGQVKDIAGECKELPNVIRDDYLAEGVRLKGLVGNPPAFNKAACLVAERFGAKYNGEPNVKFIRDGKAYPCRQYVLNFKEK